MPFRMPPIPFPMPPLFVTAVKDICAINTFEKLLNILFSEVSCWHFGFTTPFFNWYVSIWSINVVSPLTTCISIISSSPARRPWCNNSQCWMVKGLMGGGGLGLEKGYIEPFSIQILELLYLRKWNSSRSISVSILCAGENQRTYLVPFKK